MKRLILRGLLCLGLLSLGCSANHSRQPDALPTPAESEGGRKKEAAESGKPERRIPFSAVKQKAGSLQVEVIQLQDFAGDFQASGSLTFDQGLLVRVTSSVTGKLVQLNAGLGDSVRRGQILAVLEAPELVTMKADYDEAETNLRLARQALYRRQNIAVYGEEIRRPMEDARNEVATARAEIEVAQSNVRVNQQKLQRIEQLLKEGITSKAQAEQARAEYEQAVAQSHLAQKKMEISQQHLARAGRVQSLGLLSRKEIEEASADVERARKRAEHLRAGLVSLKANPDEPGSTLVIPAPMDGIVTERTVTAGESVNADENLYTLADTQRLWLWVNVTESDLSRIQRGQRVEAQVPTFPGQIFSGRISFVPPELDEKTRTAKALVIIENQRRKLRPAMFAQVRVVTSRATTLTVPSSALQKVEDLDVVYVQEGPAEFERRPVALGQRSGNRVQVLEGLKAGERIVTENSHVLKAEDLKETMEGGDSD